MASKQRSWRPVLREAGAIAFIVVSAMPIRAAVLLLFDWLPVSWIPMLGNANGVSTIGYAGMVALAAIYVGLISLVWWGLSKALKLPFRHDPQRNLPRHRP